MVAEVEDGGDDSELVRGFVSAVFAQFTPNTALEPCFELKGARVGSSTEGEFGFRLEPLDVTLLVTLETSGSRLSDGSSLSIRFVVVVDDDELVDGGCISTIELDFWLVGVGSVDVEVVAWHDNDKSLAS